MNISIKMGSFSQQEVKIFIAYYFTLVTFVVSSYFPDLRLWGFNHWAYTPDLWRYIAFAIALVAPVIVCLFTRNNIDKDNQPKKDKAGHLFVITSVLITIIAGVSFYIFRAKTHFLGDGYTVLASLASENYLIKSREIGEALIHLWIKDFIGSGESAALGSFQLISITSGIVFVIIVSILSRVLFKSNYQRLLFVVGVITSGYMLLFFGYVEYYSAFVLSVLIFTLTGLMISQGKLNRWFIIPALIFSIFMHVMGATLIPGAIYVLLSNTKVAGYYTKLNKHIKRFIISLLLLSCVAVFIYFYKDIYFFRFSIIPIFPDRFTIEGYTLFSFKHILDFINLLIVLFPPVLLFLSFALNTDFKALLKTKDCRFVLLLTLSAVGAAFIFDPKLGMPRDWDLFSFAGVPIVLFYVFLILRSALSSNVKILILTLSVILNFAVLFPRVYIQMNPSASIDRLTDYIDLDKVKNRSTYTILINYCRENGLIERANEAVQNLVEKYPEHDLIRRANQLKTDQKYNEAIRCYEKVIELNPMMAGGYANLGELYLHQKQADTALKLLKIAEGLNPYNYAIWLYIASAHYLNDDLKNAEKAWLKSISYNDNIIEPIVNLVGLYKRTGNEQQWIKYSTKASQLKNCPFYILADLGNLNIQKGDYKNASIFYKKAIENGLDKRFVEDLLIKYPQLKQYLIP